MTYRISRLAIMLSALAVATAAPLALPQNAEAAIQFGGVTSADYEGAGVSCTASTCTLAAPAITGSNAVLVLAISINAGSENLPASATYNGVSLGAPIDGGRIDSTRTAVWVVTNPASGANFVINLDNISNRGVMMAAYYTGVNQVTPYRTPTTGTGASSPATLSVTNSLTGDVIAGLFSTNDTSLADAFTEARVGAGQIYRVHDNFNAESDLALSDEPGAAGTVTHSWAKNDAGCTFVCGWSGVALPLTPASSNLSKPPNNLGLIGYWSFDEGTSTIATDFSGNGKSASFPGGGANPTWVNGKKSKALQFDGGDYLETGPTLVYGTEYATVAFWLNWDAYADDCDPVIGSGDPEAVSGGYQIIPNDCDLGGVFSAMVGGGTAGNIRVETISRPSAGVWHHYVIVFDNSTNSGEITIYLDGIAQSTGLLDAKTASGNISTQKLNMMSYAGQAGSFFGTGKLDDVRVYNRALGAPEVAALAKSGVVKFTTSSVELQQGSTLASGLVGHWTFDGPDITTVIADRSGNSNNGYMSSGMPTTSSKTIGKLGQALNFDGTNDYVTTPSQTSPSRGTVAMWIKADTLSGSRFLWSINDSFEAFIFGGGFIQGDTCATDADNSSGAIVANRWYHLVWTWDDVADLQNFYVDGALDSNYNNAITCNHTGLFDIGYREGGALANVFDGTIDDTRLYNRVLTPAEVKQLYNLGQATIRR